MSIHGRESLLLLRKKLNHTLHESESHLLAPDIGPVQPSPHDHMPSSTASTGGQSHGHGEIQLARNSLAVIDFIIAVRGYQGTSHPQKALLTMLRTVDGKGTATELPATTSTQSPPTAVAPTASDDELRDATEGEIKNLRHIVDKLPCIVWIALMVGAAERFTYYAITAPRQNYMQNGPGNSAVLGALGLEQSTATNIYNAYYFFSFLTPVPFAIISDAWLGRYKMLCISMSLYLCGCLVQFVTSLPTVLDRGGGIPGLVVSMVLIGLGVGGVKATISPFNGDQYKVVPPQVKTAKKGERVIVDRTLTIQYIYNVFYWLINVAGLSLVASTYLEKEHGFWTAYLLALCSFWIGIALLLVFGKE